MKLHEKLKKIRQEKGLSLKELYEKIQQIFGAKTAFTYRTLQRIQAGHSDSKTISLYQIATALGMTLREFKEGVEIEEFAETECLRKRKSRGRYIYNKAALAEILTGPRTEFLALELRLEAGGKTKPEKDSSSGKEFKKWVYVLVGNLTCAIGNKTYALRKGDSLTFDSSQPHCFLNSSRRKVRAIVIQSPRHI
jgi:transcriptional regulator with XRE-family HTH domain